MIVLLIVLVGLGMFAAGFWIRFLIGRRQLASAESKSKQVLEETTRQAEAIRRQAQIDA